MKDIFLVVSESRPAEPTYFDNYETDILFASGSDKLLPIIIDGKNTTAVMSSEHLKYEAAVDFCREKNMNLPEKPFEVQSLNCVEKGQPRFSMIYIPLK